MNSKIYDLYANNKISVIVPIYNEEKAVEKNLKLVEEELHKYFHNWEIIVVSDGSTDRTYEKALRRVSSHVKVLHYPNNEGKGFALKHGFYQCNGDFVCFIDSGMELHPKDIKIFLALLDIYDADAVIGSKRHPQSDIYYPWTRRILSRIYQTLIKITLNLNVTDTQVGLKLFRRKVLEDAIPRVLVKKYAFDLELLTVANHLGYHKILEAPVKLDYYGTRRWDYYGRLKKNLWFDLWRIRKMAWCLFWDTLAVIYRLRILHYYDKAPSSDKATQPQIVNSSPAK